MYTIFRVCAVVALCLFGQTAFAAVSYSQHITLEPGWNIISSPRIVESHGFSAPETLGNFSIFTLDPSRSSGWVTMAELGQTEFVPLWGYFVNNQTATSQVLTLNYKASTTPSERLFERQFTREGWYAIGVANPSYAVPQGVYVSDVNNPNLILNSLLGATSAYNAVVDFSANHALVNLDSVALSDPWDFRARASDSADSTEINKLNDFRETKGYAIYIKSTSTLNGFQNGVAPQCTDSVDNDGDARADYPYDLGCASALDDDESNLPSGTFSLTKSSVYANQSVSAPQSAYKIGSFRLSVGSTDAYQISEITLGIVGINPELLGNAYVEYGGVFLPTLPVGTTTYTWAGSGVAVPGAVIDVNVYASLPVGLQNGQTIQTTLGVHGVSLNTGDTIFSNQVSGQTITIASSALVATVDATTPFSSLVVANTIPKIASFKFQAQHDEFTINDLVFQMGNQESGAVSELIIKQGATELKKVVLVGNVATVTGLGLRVPSNASVVVDAYAQIGSIGTGFSSAGQLVRTALVGLNYLDGAGNQHIATTSLSGNAFYAFKTKPTITPVALPTTVLNSGVVTVGKFTVTADAGGTVSWKKISMNFSKTAIGTFALYGVSIYDAANESTPLANVTVATSSTAFTFTATADQEISGSKTYVVKATLTGTVLTGDSFSTTIPSGVSTYSAPAANGVVAGGSSFDWSDESVLGHTLTTNDWFDNFLVKNLPTDSQTLTK